MKKSWRDCTEAELLKMDRDNVWSGDFCLSMDGANSVSITDQPMNRAAATSITIPRETFNKLVDAYLEQREIKN